MSFATDLFERPRKVVRSQYLREALPDVKLKITDELEKRRDSELPTREIHKLSVSFYITHEAPFGAYQTDMAQFEDYRLHQFAGALHRMLYGELLEQLSRMRMKVMSLDVHYRDEYRRREIIEDLAALRDMFEPDVNAIKNEIDKGKSNDEQQ